MRTTPLFAMLLSIIAGTASQAATIGARMDVSANVVANCRLSVPPLSFGTYDPLLEHATRPDDAAVDVTVTCTRNTAASVSFDLGLHSAGDAFRGMTGPGTEGLTYQIYRDAARSQVWTQGTQAMRVMTRGVTTPDQLTVFGRIPPRQEVEPGTYSDVLTATVDF